MQRPRRTSNSYTSSNRGTRCDSRRGNIPGSYLANLNGSADAWITVTGPASEAPAVIEGAPNFNTVEIANCSYLSIENLRIDSRGIPGAFGISARGRAGNLTHHIRIEHNTLVGQNGNQQTDGISTKTPTWGWSIRYNRISGAGTGLYLGDGRIPAVRRRRDRTQSHREHHRLQHGDQRSTLDSGDSRHAARAYVYDHSQQRVFQRRSAQPRWRPPQPARGLVSRYGPGSLNLYEIYGNYFVHNHREALFQGSGRVSLHDNIFVDGPYTYPAIVLARQNAPLKVALVYNNTVYTTGPGIHLGSAALNGDVITGNLVFGSNPISGPALGVTHNLTGSFESAGQHVRTPSFDVSIADFYPLPGKCQGPAIDLSVFQSDTDYSLDFNGAPKPTSKGVVFRGAYAGAGQNPGWRLAAALKPPNTPLPKVPRLVWVSPAPSWQAHGRSLFSSGRILPAERS